MNWLAFIPEILQILASAITAIQGAKDKHTIAPVPVPPVALVAESPKK